MVYIIILYQEEMEVVSNKYIEEESDVDSSRKVDRNASIATTDVNLMPIYFR